MNITTDEIEPTPDFGEQVNTAYLQGVAKRGSHVKMLLDLDSRALVGLDSGVTARMPEQTPVWGSARTSSSELVAAMPSAGST